MNELETKLVTAMNGIVGIQQYLVGLPERKTIGQQILESKSFQAFAASKSDLCTIELKTAITSTGAANDRLVPSITPPIDAGVRRPLTVRDLLVEFPTGNGAIEMPRKSGITNNAGPQVGNSPEVRENVSLGESAFTWATSFHPIQTIGHFIPVSNQIFEDAGTLDGFIQSEMAHALAVKIEDQILNGDGSTSRLDGLLTNATAYSLRSPNLTREADIIRDAMRQVAAADFRPTAIVLNPSDWYDLDVTKAGASDDTYTAGGPRLIDGPSLWGLPVVECNSIASGTFLVGDFRNCGVLFSKDAASVEISRHDSTNFQSNMLTVKAQERMALVPTNAAYGALVTGSL